MNDMNSLGESIGGIINPNAKYLNALKMEVAKNPEIRQQLIDMDAKNPGTIKRLYGNQADSLFGQGNVSAEGQQDIFNAANTTTAPSMLPNTMEGISAARKFTGSTPDELSRQGYEANITKNASSASDAELPATQAKATYDKALALAQLQQLPDKIASENVDLATNLKNKKLIAAVESNPAVATSGGIMTNLVGNTGIIPDEAKAAILTDDGFYRLYNKLDTDRKISLQQAHYDAIDARQKATIDDQLMKNSAENKANNASRLGFSVNSDDLYNISKAGLEPLMDQLSTMNAAQLHDAAAKNPAIDQLIQHPTMIQSWIHYNAFLGGAQDKDIVPLQKQYDSLKNDFEKKASKGDFKDPTDAQFAINQMNDTPYAEMMARKGTPLPIPHYDSSNDGPVGRTFNSKKVYYTNPHDGTVLDDNKNGSAPPTTPGQAQQLDLMAQDIAKGNHTFESTIKDPQFKAFGPDASNVLATKIAQYRRQLLTQPKSGTPIPPQ